MLWVDKYAPSLDEIPQDTEVLESFVLNYGKQKKRALFLHGPPGVGKTAAVYALGKKHNLELLEVNASDVRNSEQINSRIGSALMQKSLFGGGKLLLIDELDGISGTKDRGGVQALSKLLEKSSHPVILIANDISASKLKSLKRKSVVVEFPALSTSAIVEVLKRIVSKEGLRSEEGVLRSLARRSGGDLRGAIIDLQTLSGVGLSEDSLNSLSERKQTETIKNAIFRILKSTDVEVARRALDSVSEDLDEVFLWIDENMPKEYKEPEDLCRAYYALSRADVFRGRIRKRQYWRFLSYIAALLSVGVALSKDEKPKGVVNYERAKRILSMWIAKQKYSKRTALAEKLAPVLHCSKAKAVQSISFIQAFARKDGFLHQISSELDLDEDERSWLSGRA